MSLDTMDDLRYPIGTYTPPDEITSEQRAVWIAEIAAAPAELRAAVAELDDAQLDTPYRPGGWTVRQVVHHLADSHMNAYCRFKLALTEENPTIKPYEEARWAELPEARTGELELSLSLLDALHRRWTETLRAIRDEEFARTFDHPEHGRSFRLDVTLGNYAWHGKHHVAHITSLRERQRW